MFHKRYQGFGIVELLGSMTVASSLATAGLAPTKLTQTSAQTTAQAVSETMPVRTQPLTVQPDVTAQPVPHSGRCTAADRQLAQSRNACRNSPSY